MISNRTFGVEIEGFGITHRNVIDIVTRTGYKILKTGSNYSVWNVKDDCSIDGYDSFELTTPILSGEKGLIELATVNQAMINAGMKIDNSCGLHVHVGANDLTKEEVYMTAVRYCHYEEQIAQLIAPDRNEIRTQTMKNMFKVYNNRLQYAINHSNYPGRWNIHLYSILTKGTVEFRQFGAILDTECVINWTKFCVNFIDQVKEIVAGKPDTGLYMGLDDSIADYFDQRAEFLSYNKDAR